MTTSQVAIGVWFLGAVVLFIVAAIWPTVEARHWLVPAEAAWAALVSAFYDGSRKEEEEEVPSWSRPSSPLMSSRS